MKIFVAKLSFAVKSEDLEQIFAEYGTVTSANVINDKFTGRSKGFAFVEMSDEEEAKKAIAELDGCEIDGRVIVVKEAEDRPQTERRSSGGYNGGGNRGGYGGGGDRGGYNGGNRGRY